MRKIAIDFETHLIAPGNLTPRIVCGAFAEGEKAFLEPREEALATTRMVLLNADCIVGANIAYDFGCYLRQRPEDFARVWEAYASKRVWDVQHVALLNAIAEGRLTDHGLFRRDGTKIQSGRYSLFECVLESLGRDNAKENDEYRLRYAEFDGVPLSEWPERAVQYPQDDALNTLQVADKQLGYQNLHNAPAQSWAAFAMHLGSVWGIRTDPKRVEEFATEVLQKQAELKERFQAEGFYRIGGTKKEPKLVKDTKLIKARVEKVYLGQPPRTDGGDVSTDRVTLEESGEDLLEEFAGVSKVDKLATYVPALREAARVPLNVKPNPILATGRSSYEGLIQLMPRKGGVRNCFKARDGYVLCSVDYSAIEMSGLAEACLELVGESVLADAINADMDPHSFFGAKMLGVEYDYFFKRKKEPEFDLLRQAGKAANFGFPGMMGAAKFVGAKRKEGQRVCKWADPKSECGRERTLVWKQRPTDRPMCVACLEHAEKLRRIFLDAWPEVQRYWQVVQSLIDPADDSIVQLVSQRKRGGLSAPAAANTYFQGLTADGAKAAVVELTRRMYLDTSSALYGSRLVVFAHDETILEIPEARAHEAAHEQARVMVDEMRKFVRRVKVKAEPALMRYWYKEAQPVYVDGKLVPWEPEQKAA